MRTKKQESAEQSSMAAWDRIFNDALLQIMCDGMTLSAEKPDDFTDDEDLLLMLIHERRLPSRVEGRAGGKGAV